MKCAWRGIVDNDGDVWAWPTLVADHEQVFSAFPPLRAYRARWRQWEPGEQVDFDDGASDADKSAVASWLRTAAEVEQRLENDQVRRAQRSGHCPVCGGDA